MINNDFLQYLIDTINAGSLSLMLSIGHRTRIFGVMAQLPPSTVEEIASKSNLNERYVKEWLAAMVTGKIVDYDSAANKFSLSKEKAQYLTREKSIYNFAAPCNGFLYYPKWKMKLLIVLAMEEVFLTLLIRDFTKLWLKKAIRQL